MPIIQGGTGGRVSLYQLASAVTKESGFGIVSSACLDRLVSKRTGKDIIPMKLRMKKSPEPRLAAAMQA